MMVCWVPLSLLAMNRFISRIMVAASWLLGF
jgi:hypothetical protein